MLNDMFWLVLNWWQSSTRVGEEGVTERAWFKLSQEDGVEGHSKEPACTKSQLRREYLIWEMTELSIFEKVGQEMKPRAGWTPCHEECPLSNRKWASWAQGRFFTFKMPDSSPWRNGWLQVWGRKYARWAWLRHFVMPESKQAIQDHCVSRTQKPT